MNIDTGRNKFWGYLLRKILMENETGNTGLPQVSWKTDWMPVSSGKPRSFTEEMNACVITCFHQATMGNL